jgi:hypothetical protein
VQQKNDHLPSIPIRPRKFVVIAAMSPNVTSQLVPGSGTTED